MGPANRRILCLAPAAAPKANEANASDLAAIGAPDRLGAHPSFASVRHLASLMASLGGSERAEESGSLERIKHGETGVEIDPGEPVLAARESGTAKTR